MASARSWSSTVCWEPTSWPTGYAGRSDVLITSISPFPKRSLDHALGTHLKSTSGPGRIRTCDTRPRKPLLYPLSYRPAQEWGPPRDVTVTSTALQRTVGAIEIVHPAYKLRRTLYVCGDLGHPRQPRGTRSRPWRRARGSGDYLLPWRCNRLRGEPGRVLRRGALLEDADDLGQPRPRRNRPGDGPELVQPDGRRGRAVDAGSLERGERQILAHEAAHDAD